MGLYEITFWCHQTWEIFQLEVSSWGNSWNGAFSIGKARLLTTWWNGIPPWPMITGTWWLWFGGIPRFLYKEDYFFKDQHWLFNYPTIPKKTASNQSLLNGAKNFHRFQKEKWEANQHIIGISQKKPWLGSSQLAMATNPDSPVGTRLG